MGGPGGGGGPAPTPIPGSFTYTEQTQSLVQLQAGTFSGRLQIQPSRNLSNVAFVMTGTEKCGPTTITRWDTTYSFTNWGAVNLLKQAPFDLNPIDCGASFVSHPLTWNYAWSLSNTGVPTEIGTDSATCDLQNALCADMYGNP